MVGDVPEDGVSEDGGVSAIPGLRGGAGEDEKLAVPDAPRAEGRGVPVLPEDGAGEDGKGAEPSL